jgi:hypothetical protein
VSFVYVLPVCVPGFLKEQEAKAAREREVLTLRDSPTGSKAGSVQGDPPPPAHGRFLGDHVARDDRFGRSAAARDGRSSCSLVRLSSGQSSAVCRLRVSGQPGGSGAGMHGQITAGAISASGF